MCWRRDRLPTPVFLGFLGGSAGKEFACSARDLGSILGLGRSPEEGKATCSSPSESTIKTKSPVLPYKSVTLLKFFWGSNCSMAKRLTHTPNCSMHTHSHSTNPLICSSPIVPDFRVAYGLTLPDSIPITWPSLMGSVTTHPQAFTIIIPLTFLLICQPFSHSLLCHRFISFLVHQYHFIILGGFEKDQGKVYV